ncbi:putative non-specific phospholipase C4 [Iris pallida]|uniref:Non-specific phospholipase C4 n=1 Tax=Iris pallida TaxID=29817 RepID=A0AAX6EKE2_IRIPA|nr:putative non-specific phospholipase C4 [Iris pallida]
MSTADAATATATSRIKTVVVLVQENRSFDHMLGWMKSLNPEIDGVTGQESNPLSTTDPSSKLVRFSDTAEYVDPDPGHTIQDIYEQVYGVPFAAGTTPITPDTPPLMNGFAQQAEKEKEGMSETVMRGFRPDAVPVYKELVASFAVCDRWFASLPASTVPNRLCVHSATSHGLTSNVTEAMIEGLPQKTIFDSLHDEGHSFGIYYQHAPITLVHSTTLDGHRSLRKLKYIGNFYQFDLSFKDHCEKGKLPNYVVVEQRYFDLDTLPANDDHPSHDVSEGQKFVKEVYEALRSSPQWNEMLLIVTYDEHGGFYDHVPTPVGVPSPDGIVGPEPFYFKFDRLGVRVPAIFISPWIEAGTVVHRPSGPYPSSEFEHSSVPAIVKKIFNLKNFLTKRDEWAGTFDTVLTRTTPRTDCPVTLPEPKKLRPTEAAEDRNLSDFQKELVQMAAVLNGDYATDVFPDRLVEEMTVAQAASYVLEAFDAFKSACRKCQKNGEDGDHIVVANPSDK